MLLDSSLVSGHLHEQPAATQPHHRTTEGQWFPADTVPWVLLILHKMLLTNDAVPCAVPRT
jgi:hypothetical protein